MQVTDPDTSLIDALLGKFIDIREKESFPANYEWYVTDNAASRIYDEITPVNRSKYTDHIDYGPDGFVCRTDSGAICVVTDNDRATNGVDDGEVVARFNGDMTLVRYEFNPPA